MDSLNNMADTFNQNFIGFGNSIETDLDSDMKAWSIQADAKVRREVIKRKGPVEELQKIYTNKLFGKMAIECTQQYSTIRKINSELSVELETFCCGNRNSVTYVHFAEPINKCYNKLMNNIVSIIDTAYSLDAENYIDVLNYEQDLELSEQKKELLKAYNNQIKAEKNKCNENNAILIELNKMLLEFRTKNQKREQSVHSEVDEISKLTSQLSAYKD